MAKVRNWLWSHLFAITGAAVAILILLAMNAFGQSVNIGRIGGVLQSGDNLVDTVNHAFKVNIVASSGLTVTASGNLGRSWALSSATDSVNVGNFPASYAVIGTFWQSVQPVSGTFWQAIQPVSGTFWQATQPISGSVSVSNFPPGVSVVNFPATQAVVGMVVTLPAPPPMSDKVLTNPLLYKAAMRVYCQTNLNGCGK